MNPRTEILPEKKLAGKRMPMSFAANRTVELWSSFMPHRKEIQHTTGTELYSVEVYPPGFFEPFDPSNEFDKWAAVAVTGDEQLPVGMETLAVPSGLYAVFLHKGPASEGVRTYGYVFEQWLPYSEYELDDRPHFALMGDKYKREAPDSEEEIWIPVRLRQEENS